MADRIERMGVSGESVIQHGRDSERVYGMKLADADMPGILDEIEALAKSNRYGKLFVKAHADHLPEFAARGYQVEAMVPGFHGAAPGLFLSKFLVPERADDQDPDRILEVIEAAEARGDETPEEHSFDVKVVEDERLDSIATLYGRVFDSYPFPIDEVTHLRAEVERGTRYFAAGQDGRLLAASAMEPGGAEGVVEMTDFATLESERGRGLATALLGYMERHALESGVRVAYTIARARSFGMNITFARHGYRHRGTLINNTGIAGSIESMNVWSKRLRKPDDEPTRAAPEAVAAQPE